MRKLQTLVAAAVAATLLAGCGGGSATPAASGEPSSAPAGGSGETLVVYTNSNGEGRGDWLTAKAAEAGFKIEIVGAGGADATNKLIAEKNNPIADVAFGLNNMYFSQVKAAGALEPYEPAWAGDVDKELGDGEAYWPLVKQAILLGYNSDKFPKDKAPQDWTDLWTKDEFKASYERVTGLGTATAQLVFAGILSRYRMTPATLASPTRAGSRWSSTSRTAARQWQRPISLPGSLPAKWTWARCRPRSSPSARSPSK